LLTPIRASPAQAGTRQYSRWRLAEPRWQCARIPLRRAGLALRRDLSQVRQNPGLPPGICRPLQLTRVGMGSSPGGQGRWSAHIVRCRVRSRADVQNLELHKQWQPLPPGQCRVRVRRQRPARGQVVGLDQSLQSVVACGSRREPNVDWFEHTGGPARSAAGTLTGSGMSPDARRTDDLPRFLTEAD